MPHDSPAADTVGALAAPWAAPADVAPADHPADPATAAAYMAGERAALARAFREALPSQQALGALAAAVKRLEARARDGDAAAAAAAAAAATALEAARGAAARVDALERERVTPLEAAVRDAPADRLSLELGAVLAALTASLDAAAAAAAAGNADGGVAGFLGRALDGADAAARAVAARVLLDSETRRGGGARALSGNVIAGALLLAALEIGFQAHRAAARSLPPPARRAARPLGGALGLARGAAWAAALTLGAVGLRRVCGVVAERVLLAAGGGAEDEGGDGAAAAAPAPP